ncbi:kinase-like domain-containing protein [Dichotomopilus funicola]|uniref:Kinase-like domain-containing protein n=1 Tax=Dichotomopilus funicola TaxID=1934379 RepID=A0AAN6VBK0_9PEZI|nr:kinase-like domain-containing protein [Dichotomopilus funicola]
MSVESPPSETHHQPSDRDAQSQPEHRLAPASAGDARANSAPGVDIVAFPAVSDLPCVTGVTALPSSTNPSPSHFRSRTIAPSPPVSSRASRPQSPSTAAQDFLGDLNHLTRSPDSLSHAPETPFHLHTESAHPAYGHTTPGRPIRRSGLSLRNSSSAQSLRPISRTPSLKTGLYGPFGSTSAASSVVASPVISAMGDLTPLPSPLLASDSPGPWKKLNRRPSREDAMSPPTSVPLESDGCELPSKPTKKGYSGVASFPTPVNQDSAARQEGRLAQPPATHTRNRSISEYIPDPMLIPKRMSTMSGTRAKPDLKTTTDGQLRREPHLSEARGLTPIEKPPTPPPSESSLSAADLPLATALAATTRSNKQPSSATYFIAYGRDDQKRRRWRMVRPLGQGTFSQVYLATSQASSSSSDDEDGGQTAGTQNSNQSLTRPRRSLVAVKVCEQGPRGGASEERIEMSLKRELELMQSVRHPSIVQLKAWSIEPTRAILVLGYYPGGDLFEVASRHRALLTPSLIRRMFSELVGAVRYLHAQNIVHRDIKLENVLVNLPPSELAPSNDWTTYPYSVTTLTDLGLSRRVAPDEKLETRCGSDDYAAPEVIIGQPYDGRATDAWSLGVLLYALLESRLPFDPPPSGPQGVDHATQMRMRSRTSHRIARVEWRWFLFGAGEGEDGDGDHEAEIKKFEEKGLVGAMEVVEGLLKRARSRWPLNQVAETEWVGKAVNVEGGIRFMEEEEGEEI